MHRKLIAVPLVVILFLLTTPGPALADGGFFTEEMFLDIWESAQRAVILYGNSTGDCTGNCTGNITGNFTEHLILAVSFEGNVADFAWVIPVPNIPEITVTDPQLFWELYDLTRTQIPSGGGGWFFCGAGGAGAPEQDGVDVIEEEVVGPYATAILSATNATALTDWLNANGYIFPEGGEGVINEYIEREWYFVATKINVVKADNIYALADGTIEPIVLSFASNQTVYPMRISSLSASNSTPPEILLYVLADHVMVPEQYPLYIGYGNWTDDAFTLEFANNLSVEDLSEYEILPELVSTYLPGDRFCLTKLRGWISADQMVDIEMIIHEETEPLHSLAGGDADGSNVVLLATIIGPVFGLCLWRRCREIAISRGPRQ